MTTPSVNSGYGLKMVIGSGTAIFVVSACFWAGATYNRVDGIEKQLGVINTQIAKLGSFQTLDERSLADQRRIEKLEDAVIKIEMDKKFGNR